MAKNMVIAGDYSGKPISYTLGSAVLMISIGNALVLNKKVVDEYQEITEEHRKSAASGVARGIVGGALLGPVGLLAGGLSAKSKGTHVVAISFKDGKRSLIEVDSKLYKGIVKDCF